MTSDLLKAVERVTVLCNADDGAAASVFDKLAREISARRELRSTLRVLLSALQPPVPAEDVVDLTKLTVDAPPCPFCDSDAVFNWFSHDAAPNTWAMFCETCGAEGPHCGDESQSVSLWSRRAQEDRAYAAIQRLGSMEAFARAGIIKSDRDEELIARIDFARAALKGRAALAATPPDPRIARLEAALKPFADIYDQIIADHGVDWFSDEGQAMRAALSYPVAHSAVVWRHFRLASEARAARTPSGDA